MLELMTAVEQCDAHSLASGDTVKPGPPTVPFKFQIRRPLLPPCRNASVLPSANSCNCSSCPNLVPGNLLSRSTCGPGLGEARIIDLHLKEFPLPLTLYLLVERKDCANVYCGLWKIFLNYSSIGEN
jgi:hypothetical protein